MKSSQFNSQNSAMGYYPKDIYTTNNKPQQDERKTSSLPDFSSIFNTPAEIQSLLNGGSLNDIIINKLTDSKQQNSLSLLSNLFSKNTKPTSSDTTKSLDENNHFEEL